MFNKDAFPFQNHAGARLCKQVLVEAYHFVTPPTRSFKTAGDVAVGPDSVPGLMLPASLTALFLLSLVQAAFLSLAPTTLQRLTIKGDAEGPAEGPVSWLSGLDRLQHLTCLDLLQSGSFLCQPPGPAYSALTASSSLVHLFLQLWDPVGMHGIWKYVFPSGRKLPDLKVIGFACTSWGVADLRSIISCCPSLSDVFKLWLEPEVQVSELHALTALKSLAALYESQDLDSFEGFIQGVAAITGLRNLDFHEEHQQVKMASLLPLTSLTLLTQLQLSGPADSAQLANLGTPLPSSPQWVTKVSQW